MRYDLHPPKQMCSIVALYWHIEKDDALSLDQLRQAGQHHATDARALLLVAAEMARHVYMGDQSTPEASAGIHWIPITVAFREDPHPDSPLVDEDAMYLPQGTVPLAAVQKSSGFRAMAVQLGELYFVVNSGLDDPDETTAEEAANDLKAVLALAQGEASASHLMDALYFNQTLMQQHIPEGANVIYVGHSLGGALAAGQAFHAWLKGYAVTILTFNPIAARAFVTGIARTLNVPNPAAAVGEFEQACRITNYVASNQQQLKQKLREGIRMLWQEQEDGYGTDEEHLIARQVLTVLGTNHTRLGRDIVLPNTSHDIDSLLQGLRRDHTVRANLTREVIAPAIANQRARDPYAMDMEDDDEGDEEEERSATAFPHQIQAELSQMPDAAPQQLPAAQSMGDLVNNLGRDLSPTELKTVFVIIKLETMIEKNGSKLVEKDTLQQFRHNFRDTLYISDEQQREEAQSALVSQLFSTAYNKVAAFYGE